MHDRIVQLWPDTSVNAPPKHQHQHAGDLNVEPSRVPSLQKGIVAGHWFDLQASWTAAAGLDPAPTCKQAFGATGGSRRDFFLGCPLASVAMGWCRVLDDSWVLPRHSVRASFRLGRWSVKFCQPVSFSVIWPAAWISAVDRTRSSKAAEVRRIWEVYDECLQVVHPGFLLRNTHCSLGWRCLLGLERLVFLRRGIAGSCLSRCWRSNACFWFAAWS